MKSIFDIMSDSENYILEFDRACDRLLTSKIVLSDKRISEVLKIIAKSRKLYEIIEASLVDFNFTKELMRMDNLYLQNNFFSMPQLPKKHIIAFVFCLLYSFDTKKFPVQDFAHRYFESEQPSNEYSAFLEAFIVPFRSLVGQAYIGELDVNNAPQSNVSYAGSLEEKPKQHSFSNLTPDYGAEEAATLSENDSLDRFSINSILNIIREITGIIARNPSISTKEREDLLLICESFHKSVEHGSAGSIRIMHIALKKSLECSSLTAHLEMQYDNLEKLLIEYKVI